MNCHKYGAALNGGFMEASHALRVCDKKKQQQLYAFHVANLLCAGPGAFAEVSRICLQFSF